MAPALEPAAPNSAAAAELALLSTTALKLACWRASICNVPPMARVVSSMLASTRAAGAPASWSPSSASSAMVARF